MATIFWVLAATTTAAIHEQLNEHWHTSPAVTNDNLSLRLVILELGALFFADDEYPSDPATEAPLIMLLLTFIRRLKQSLTSNMVVLAVRHLIHALVGPRMMHVRVAIVAMTAVVEGWYILGVIGEISHQERPRRAVEKWWRDRSLWWTTLCEDVVVETRDSWEGTKLRVREQGLELIGLGNIHSYALDPFPNFGIMSEVR
ncbi:hypothetical protein T439DRAFT_363032 [Meredithblackwellia eburnea MCA 4105]